MRQELDDLCKQLLAGLDDDLGGLYLRVREDNGISDFSKGHLLESIQAMRDKIQDQLEGNV